MRIPDPKGCGEGQGAGMPPSPWSLLVRPSFSNPRSLRQEQKSRAVWTCPQRRRDQVREILKPTGLASLLASLEVTTSARGVASIVCGRSWWLGEVFEDGKKANGTLLGGGQEGGSRELRAGKPHINPWEGHNKERIFLEAVFQIWDRKEVTGSSQRGFTKGR